MTGTPASAAADAASKMGRDLRHADAADDAGGADGARADADLHAIDAGLDQIACPVGRGMLPAMT